MTFVILLKRWAGLIAVDGNRRDYDFALFVMRFLKILP